ncbi:DUF3106 domain-containing protein [Variovorax sp. LT2P21]|uniref:DUF3106 domain-containing protein n=1 Tax=Variovorax sp. LT2P21 TaxID=3443731 RepID=UPI003F446827
MTSDHAPDARCVRLPRRPRTRSAAWLVGTMLLWVAATVSVGQVQAQAPSSAPAPAASPAKPLAKPLWRDLSAKQQQALQPLATDWDALSEGHKRKWLTLSRNHAKLSPAEKATLHSRMTEWTALSRQQRDQARFNFAEVKQVPADERKAKWEAYQALTPEEKRRLAESAAPRPPGAAGTIRPVPAQKLVPLPTEAIKGQHSARIQLAPPAEAVAPAPMIATPSAPVEASAPTPAMSPPAPVVPPLP